MTKVLYILLSVVLFVQINGCRSKLEQEVDEIKEKKKEKKEKSYGKTTLTGYDIEKGKPEIIELDSPLIEISELAIDDSGRVFAHGDESARVYQIDLKTGKIIKFFSVGDPALDGDFEGIAFAKGNWYLVGSNGNLLEFKEGDNEGSVEYIVHKTNLGSKYDVEGLCYDEKTNSLLLACKGFPGEDLGKNVKAIYAISLDSLSMSEKPRYIIDLDEIDGDFNPSGIELNPHSNTFFVIASKGNSILEITLDGKIINQSDLPKEFHKQPEGITFLPDKSLLLSNEGGSDYGYIAIYKYNE